jgi:hypothetical protein
MWVRPASRVFFGNRGFCAAPMELGRTVRHGTINMALLTELERPAPRANFTSSKIFAARVPPRPKLLPHPGARKLAPGIGWRSSAAEKWAAMRTHLEQKSSARSAMFIARNAPFQPSSVGAACGSGRRAGLVIGGHGFRVAPTFHTFYVSYFDLLVKRM